MDARLDRAGSARYQPEVVPIRPECVQPNPGASFKKRRRGSARDRKCTRHVRSPVSGLPRAARSAVGLGRAGVSGKGSETSRGRRRARQCARGAQGSSAGMRPADDASGRRGEVPRWQRRWRSLSHVPVSLPSCASASRARIAATACICSRPGAASSCARSPAPWRRSMAIGRAICRWSRACWPTSRPVGRPSPPSTTAPRPRSW